MLFMSKEDTDVIFPENEPPFLRRNGVAYGYGTFPRTIVVGSDREPVTVESPSDLRRVLSERGYVTISLLE